MSTDNHEPNAGSVDLERTALGPSISAPCDKAKISTLQAEWVGASSEGRARGLVVHIVRQPVLSLRFDRSVPVPPEPALVGHVASVLMSVRFGDQARAATGAPKTAVALIRYLLSTEGTRHLQSNLPFDASRSASLSQDILRLLLGELAEVFVWIYRNFDAPSTWIDAHRRLLGLLLRNPAPSKRLWHTLRQRGTPGMLLVAAPLIEGEIGEQTVDAWIHAHLGRPVFFERLRHAPPAWTAEIVDAMPAPQHVRGYLSMLVGQLRAARLLLALEEERSRQQWLRVMAALCARLEIVRCKSWPDQLDDCNLLRLDCAVPGKPPAHPLARGVRRQFLLRIIKLFITQLQAGEKAIKIRDDLHRVLDWLTHAVGSIPDELLRQGSHARIVDEATFWRMLQDCRDSWPCALEADPVSAAGWEIRDGRGWFRMRSVNSTAELRRMGERFSNCLRMDDTWQHYRRQCVRGTLRLFLISSALTGKELGLLALSWREGKWFVTDAKGRGNKPLDSVLSEHIATFVAAYNRVHPNAYSPASE